MNEVIILLGTNQGDKKNNLMIAIDQLNKILKNQVRSSVYETAAWGKENQPSFYNLILKGMTALNPFELLKEVLSIENDMGRVRLEKWAERLIDIDILYFENKIVHSKTLTIPHPHIQDRRFTLMPLAEIIPGKNHPIYHKTQAQLLEACKDPLVVKLLAL